MLAFIFILTCILPFAVSEYPSWNRGENTARTSFYPTPDIVNTALDGFSPNQQEARSYTPPVENITINEHLSPYLYGFHMVKDAFKAKYPSGSVGLRELMTTYLRATSGTSRMLMMRLVEVMDADKNYVISEQEATSFLGSATATPVEAIKAIFKLYDLDESTFITKYEWASVILISTEADTTMLDIWRLASQDFHNRDFNGDGIVTEEEFIMNELYEIAYAIGTEIQDAWDTPTTTTPSPEKATTIPF